MISDFILGPYEQPARFNGEGYLLFLGNSLSDLFEHVVLNIRQGMWFMQDGAPAHYSVQIRSFLNERFPHSRIGRGCEFPLPARCPDLNPLDFNIWVV